MLSLAIDCSGGSCAVALHDSADDRILGETTKAMTTGHAEHLIGMVDDLLAENRVEPDALGQVFAAAGPGSFTGIRIGLAAAQGYALGLSIPAFGLNVLEGLAQAAGSHDPEKAGQAILVCLDARRGQLYCQIFSGGERPNQSEPFLSTPAEIAELLNRDRNVAQYVCGSGGALVHAVSVESPPLLHELHTAPISVLARLGANRPESRLEARPIYLRAADAKPQKGFALARR